MRVCDVPGCGCKEEVECFRIDLIHEWGQDAPDKCWNLDLCKRHRKQLHEFNFLELLADAKAETIH